MTFTPIPRARTLSIMPTWRCTAACKNCGSLSSPDERTSLHDDEVRDAIDQASSLDYVVVVFTGGEPMLAGRRLLSYIAYAASRNLLTRIVTNAYWAINPRVAARRVKDLVDSGLNEINFSTGDEHARFVPVSRVIEAMYAAAEAGLRVALMIELHGERSVTRSTVEQHPRYAELRHRFPDREVTIHESPWMPLNASKHATYPDGVAVNRKNVALRKGCDSVLDVTTIEADGNIGACCGIGLRTIPELQLGNIRDTPLKSADEAADDDFLKHWLRVEGPEKILAWAATHNTDIEWENQYGHRCQACARLYRDPQVRDVIRKHHVERIGDVIATEYLLFHHPSPDDHIPEVST